MIFWSVMLFLSVAGVVYRFSIGGEVVEPMLLVGMCISFAIIDHEARL